MKNTNHPIEGKLYFTKDGMGNVIKFNEGRTGNILPIEVESDGRVWVTNIGILPIARKVEAITDNYHDAAFIKY